MSLNKKNLLCRKNIILSTKFSSDVNACYFSFTLPGEDFDQRIMEYFIKLIKKKHGKDISKDNRALGKLRREAERAKRALSSQHQVRVDSIFWINFLEFCQCYDSSQKFC